VPTDAALRFVGEATWSALSGHPVATDVWTDAHDVPHVGIGRSADLVVVAPATADLLARAAHGLADDLLTSTLLTVTCPVLLAPAMHTEMWEHPATRANVATLRERGVHVVDPAVGRLTGADSGAGRLPEPEDLLEHVRRLLADVAAPHPADLQGRRVVVTAGGTREPLDPVRFLGNASSGRQGVALAEAARDRGAEVHLVAAHVETPLPDGVRTTRVGTAAELHDAVVAAVADADVLVMAAAVADYRPEQVSGTKIKKVDGVDDLELRLVRTVDVLASVAHDRPHPGLLVVGFAAETGDGSGDVRRHAEAKLRAKGCDLLVVNDVSGGAVFGHPDNQVVVLAPEGAEGADGAEGVREVATTALVDKRAVAHTVLDAVAAGLAERPPASG
jgi:phosphopantothenoylcysteine decarboxylase / phosphopantothenate---cysteine ligase